MSKRDPGDKLFDQINNIAREYEKITGVDIRVSRTSNYKKKVHYVMVQWDDKDNDVMLGL